MHFWVWVHCHFFAIFFSFRYFCDLVPVSRHFGLSTLRLDNITLARRGFIQHTYHIFASFLSRSLPVESCIRCSDFFRTAQRVATVFCDNTGEVLWQVIYVDPGCYLSADLSFSLIPLRFEYQSLVAPPLSQFIFGLTAKILNEPSVESASCHTQCSS